MNTGKAGEECAASFLVSKGFHVITKNYHSRYGEIDLIAVGFGFLIFVEVKTRKPNSLVGALESVSPQKIQRIQKTAEQYLSENPTDLQPRYDVIAVVIDKSNYYVDSHIENAF